MYVCAWQHIYNFKSCTSEYFESVAQFLTNFNYRHLATHFMCQLITTYRHVHTMPWTTNSFKNFHGTIFSWISWFDFWSQNIDTVNIIHSCMFGTSIYGVCVIIIFQLLLLSTWYILVFTTQKADLVMLKALCHAWLLHSCKIQLPCMGYEVIWLSVMCGRQTCTYI